MNLVTSNGTMLQSEPLIDPELVQGLHQGIPTQPHEDYLEAVNDLVHKAFKSSAVMSRRALQGALLSKKVPEDTPMKMIQWAQSNEILGPRELNLANTVSFFGGKGGHPEESEINLIGELEALQGLRVIKQILLALFPHQKSTVPAQHYNQSRAG